MHKEKETEVKRTFKRELLKRDYLSATYKLGLERKQGRQGQKIDNTNPNRTKLHSKKN